MYILHEVDVIVKLKAKQTSATLCVYTCDSNLFMKLYITF